MSLVHLLSCLIYIFNIFHVLKFAVNVGKDWTCTHDTCYYLHHGAQLTPSQAKSDCEEKGAKLVEIETKEEMELIASIVRRMYVEHNINFGNGRLLIGKVLR